MDCSYIVTVKDVGNITNDPDNIHTILTSTDNIQPRERVMVRAIPRHPVTLEAARYNPSFTPELEATIRESVRIVEEQNVTIIGVRPVKHYGPEQHWDWNGYILVESDGDQREFNLDGICIRASSAYEVPR